MTPRILSLLILAVGVSVLAGETVAPRKPERQRWSWNQFHAEVTATGDLKWAPKPFKFEAGASVRYIDFEQGKDDNAGDAKTAAWKHHPWDPAATGKAKDCKGIHTYVFKAGVVYRGNLVASESGEAGNPIRLTSDPAWGKGEAVLCGSERVTGWTKGSTNKDIPDGDKVWFADVNFLPRNVFEVNGDKIERVPLARTPNWKVSDKEDVLSEWFKWEQPEWWTGKWHINTPQGKRHMGIDTKNLTHDEAYYKDATIRTEYAIVMGTPFPTKVESFDAAKKGLVFQGIWFGDSEQLCTGNRYYLEDKAQFLDSAGEFWFERKGEGGRLFIRLPEDRDPNQSTVEAAKNFRIIEDLASAKSPDRLDIINAQQIDALETNGVSHVAITGLSFRFINTQWDMTLPGWGGKNVTNAAIHLRGSGSNIRIANCRFEHLVRAIRIDPIHSRCVVDQVVVSDNDVQYTDQGSMVFAECGGRGTADPLNRTLRDVKVLRNHTFMCGMRTHRQDHDFNINVDNAETCEVAGNMVERSYGTGIFVTRGKDFFGGSTRDVPLQRALVYNNRVLESLLTANDWGGIEVNAAGAACIFNNISGNPNGYWNWGYNPGKPGSARLGMAYYLDFGGSKTYLFNNVAWSLTSDPASKLCGHCAFYEAGPNIMNAYFNNTACNFMMGSNWSPAGGRYMSLGNVWMNIASFVFMHGKVKEDKDPPPQGEYPLFSDAYGKNVFFGTGKNLAVFENGGKAHETVESFSEALAAKKSLSPSVGTMAKEAPVANAATQDFRLKGGSAAIDQGVKYFVPWPLSRTVGEWNFRRNNADATVLLDDHFYPASYAGDRIAYVQSLLFPLKATNITEKDYIQGQLEDWTFGALTLNGTDQFATLTQAEMTKGFEFKDKQQKTHTASGKEIASPDIDKSNFLVEAYLQTKPGQTAGAIVSKMKESGYELAIGKNGGAAFTIKAGDQILTTSSSAIISDGKWHHILAELDRGAKTMTLYVDGVKARSVEIALTADASLSNDADLLVGKSAAGEHLAGAIDFLRICRGTLADAKTTIEELYDWQFDGPFLRDFRGKEISGKSRDAGAFEFTGE